MTPTMGKQRREVENNIYSFPYVNHVVCYTIDKNQLVVLVACDRDFSHLKIVIPLQIKYADMKKLTY